ncbi:MAG TPA: tRNA guanosine(34) transglycosylase Tgt [Blastocatellia bacterium]|nr:tRNA guanosine(34) transglycosylase Tgt [Blastocatellia bacterium]
MGEDRKTLVFREGQVRTPAFLPDATHGVVRSLDSLDLEKCGIEAVVMNIFHLMQRPGSSTIKALGGLRRMSGWRRPIVTDSGGFQAYSLIRENPRFGSISDRGISFQPEASNRKFHLTPEKSVQLQIGYGSNIVICLDDCPHPDDSLEVQKQSVERTIKWARRCKDAFEQAVEQKGLADQERPLLFAVIQGGSFVELRRRCASELLEMGFDGFGFGGWPFDSRKRLLLDVIAYTREIVPRAFPMHALGVGHPVNVAAAFSVGYDLFDSALPTRDARNGRLYSLSDGLDRFPDDFSGDWFSYVYISDKKWIKDDGPIFPDCDCYSCASYPAGYLHHLFKIGDSLFFRLATIHNLRFMTLLTGRLGCGRGAKPSPSMTVTDE